MAHWNGERIVSWKPQPIEGYDGWTAHDCGCANGIEWGGDYPRDCRTCKGGGWYAVHDATGTMALYPGGPLIGRLLAEEET